MALPAANPHDIDNLLAGYRAARAQQALFDPRGGSVTGYDDIPFARDSQDRNAGPLHEGRP